MDWAQPALPQAANWLLDSGLMMNHVDLSETVVVLPGRRAGRRLTEILVQESQRRGFRFSAPKMITVGELPEELYQPKLPFASDLVQQLAWTQALRQTKQRQLQTVVPNLPKSADDARWLELGSLLSAQHQELAADALHFGDVAEKGSKVRGFREVGRWNVLRSVQEAYLRTLDDLQLWDKPTARLFASEHNECKTAKNIVLVGTVDMNVATRRMLDQVADRVTVLTHAPESLKSRFDSLGCLKPDQWMNEIIDVRREHIHQADGPIDQAAVLSGAIAQLDGKYRADEISIGICDENIVEHIQSHLGELETPTRWLIRGLVRDTLPCRLLSLLAEYTDDRKFARFAALVRHSDVGAWLAQKDLPENWITDLDQYFDVHLPSELGEWLGRPEVNESVRQAHQAVEQLSLPLMGRRKQPREWASILLRVILDIYDEVDFARDDDDDSATIAALKQIHTALLDLTRIPETIALKFSASEVIRLVLDQLTGATLISTPNPDAIEMLGWLELPLDDAPVAIVTTFNDDCVPRSLNSDLFLPNELRRRLGLIDNNRYFARDAYALNAVLASREVLRLIVAKRNADDAPLMPSRLLFATDGIEIAERCLQFFDETGDGNSPRLDIKTKTSASEGQFEVPRPVATEPLTEISVTAFRSFLQCPYRFYLRHVLKLQTLDDSKMELDPLQFGNLAHDVLHAFGLSELKDSTNPESIQKFLDARSYALARQRFGTKRMAAIEIQLLQLSARLEAFSVWQADRRQAGWRIEHVEVGSKQFGDVPISLKDGRSLILRGRIDRIDFHEQHNEWQVFDYKTSEKDRSPDQAHRRRTPEGDYEWIDLQLPLYRHLAEPLGVKNPQLGYIVLPKDRKFVEAKLADWTPSQLAHADRTAENVVAQVLSQSFWPPSNDVPAFIDEYQAICQSKVFERHLAWA
jgi:ATP-dependent helicase/nuclease subunit B